MSRADPLSAGSRQRFSRALAQRFFLRFHVSLIIAFTFSAAFMASKGLLALGLESMPLRYLLALAAGYLAFLLGCRLWIFYVSLFGRQNASAPRAGLRDERKGSIDLADLGSGGWGSGSGGNGGGGVPFRGGGGGFSGAGASSDFVAPGGGGSGGGGGGKGGGFSLDLGDDGLALIFLIAVIAAIAGTVIYVLYAGPTMLADAAFEALVAGGFVRRARRLDEGWLGSLLKATWIPLVLLLITLMGFAYYAQKAYPGARTAGEVLAHLYQHWQQ